MWPETEHIHMSQSLALSCPPRQPGESLCQDREAQKKRFHKVSQFLHKAKQGLGIQTGLRNIMTHMSILYIMHEASDNV